MSGLDVVYDTFRRLRSVGCSSADCLRLVGTNRWNWDAPFSHTKRRVMQTGEAGIIWEGQRAGREIGCFHFEKLHNLEALPSDGFEIVCLPIKVHPGSVGSTRAAAIFLG